jgi:undecaprenyl diphosphate synthase
MQNSLKHVAIIMDGNGRWAKKRGLPRLSGHEAGARATRRIVELVKERGIKFLTIYAFSSENWQRPMDEVEGLWQLLDRFIDEEIGRLRETGVNFNVIGDMSRLSKKLTAKIDKTIELTRENDAVHLTIALSYGGRDEILRAVGKIVKDGKAPEDEEAFRSYLDTGSIPDPDLLIRTGGEWRISNFLLWQIAYTEIYFTDTLWPDFDGKALDDAIAWFATRERRYGMTSEQVEGKRC